MTELQVKNLTQVYNTLLLISTRGEETVIMAECLKALQKIIEEGAEEVGLTVQKGLFDESENKEVEE